MNSNQTEGKVTAEPVMAESNVVTTDEEIEGFFIVKSILRETIDHKRITYRDAQSYFAILLDDNNRKTICRLYLGNKKYLVVLDENKKEIYSHAELLKTAIEKLEFIKSAK